MSLGRLGRVEGRFVAPKSSPRALWRAFGAEVARRRRPGRSRKAPGSILGGILVSKTAHVGRFFEPPRPTVFGMLLNSFFVYDLVGFNDFRAAGANGAHADDTVKTNGFEPFFKLCFRAGELQGEQNTHASDSKNACERSFKHRIFLDISCFFSVPVGLTVTKRQNDPPEV